MMETTTNWLTTELHGSFISVGSLCNTGQEMEIEYCSNATNKNEGKLTDKTMVVTVKNNDNIMQVETDLISCSSELQREFDSDVEFELQNKDMIITKLQGEIEKLNNTVNEIMDERDNLVSKLEKDLSNSAKELLKENKTAMEYFSRCQLLSITNEDFQNNMKQSNEMINELQAELATLHVKTNAELKEKTNKISELNLELANQRWKYTN